MSFGYYLNTDIIYTPLDVPPQPDIDIEKFNKWLKDNFQKVNEYRSTLIGHGKTAESKIENYPWDLTPVFYRERHEGKIIGDGWICNFKEDWPELVDWIITAFGIPEEDLGMIAFLPMRAGHQGLGFWHADLDPHGLRFYVDFDHLGTNKLFMRRTKRRNHMHPQYKYPLDEEKYLQDEVMECKIVHPRQAFFLNNLNACHATYQEIPNVTRIATFVTCIPDKPTVGRVSRDIVLPLVQRSAEKYKDYALHWKDESQD